MVSPEILVVEDDAALVRSIARNLSARGHTVHSAPTVTAALQLLDEACPALLLLDIDLPDGSGWEVLRRLRARGCADTAVIVMSGLRPNPRLVAEFTCAAVLEKPFPMDALVRLMCGALHRAASASTPAAGS